MKHFDDTKYNPIAVIVGIVFASVLFWGVIYQTLAFVFNALF